MEKNPDLIVCPDCRRDLDIDSFDEEHSARQHARNLMRCDQLEELGRNH